MCTPSCDLAGTARRRGPVAPGRSNMHPVCPTSRAGRTFQVIDPLIGQRFGQYQLQDRIGRGGMAVVYRALQPGLGRSVAVKVLSLAQIPDPTLPERFRREARLAANLMHPNIVPVYDFGEWHGYMYIVMGLIAGGTLKDRMHGPIPVEPAVRLVSQVADALGYAHGQGVFHRDVKPTNVLFGAGDWAMLSD